MIGEDLVWQTGAATLHGEPVARSIATTPDARTTIEIIGPPEQIKQVVVAAQMLDEATAKQAAAYMAITLRLILPQWAGADAWLAASLRQIKRHPQTITVQGWNIRMRWIANLNTAALQATR